MGPRAARLGRSFGFVTQAEMVAHRFRSPAIAALMAIISLGCVVCGRQKTWVQVEKQADGSYQAELCGHFTLQVGGDEPFRMRLLIRPISCQPLRRECYVRSIAD